jgi:hypothetical protein
MTGMPSIQTMPVILTEHEKGWIDFIRLIAKDRDPPPTLAAVQALGRALSI